jgi:predicted  nucleic acid-binding Zn-ribbon protein
LDKVHSEIEELRCYIESEKQRNMHLDNEMKRLINKIQHQEELLRVEKERINAKEHAIAELTQQIEHIQIEH